VLEMRYGVNGAQRHTLAPKIRPTDAGVKGAGAAGGAQGPRQAEALTENRETEQATNSAATPVFSPRCSGEFAAGRPSRHSKTDRFSPLASIPLRSP